LGSGGPLRPQTTAMIGLADGNAFFCSCELVFRPELVGRPVVVLSNNDGCVVSRTDEAKLLGIPMGAPWFQLKELVAQKQVYAFSSNFHLYADMSRRMMKVLAEFVPEIEVYSVDEAFLSFAGMKMSEVELQNFLLRIKDTVKQATGIPICVGLGPTKVLAKVANRLAKKQKSLTQGVMALTNQEKIKQALAQVPVGDIWGIGKQYAKQCQRFKIETALDFAHAPAALIQREFTVVGQRIALELQGITCFELGAEPEPKKQILSSRSFGRPVMELSEMQEAVANHVTSVAEKLRKQKSLTYQLTVFLTTNPFRNTPQYYNSAWLEIPGGSAHTPKLIKVAWEILGKLYRGGFEYKKVGVILDDIRSKNEAQMDLFAPSDTRQQETTMEMLDQVNQRHGKGSLKPAACGTHQFWKMLSQSRSPCYTTRWNEILQIKN
jgi:DNA polymerase V